MVRGHWTVAAIEAICLMKADGGWSLKEDPKKIEAEVRRRVPAMRHEEGLSFKGNTLKSTIKDWSDRINPIVYRKYTTAGKTSLKKSGHAVAVHPHTDAYRGYVSDASKAAKAQGKSGTITTYSEGWRESELNPLVTEGKYYESGRKRKRVDEQTAQAQREYDSGYNQRRKKQKKEDKNVVESALNEEALNMKI